MTLKEEIIEYISNKKSNEKILTKKQVMIIFGVSYSAVNLIWEFLKGKEIIKCEKGKECVKL